jgi:hypothetical protein
MSKVRHRSAGEIPRRHRIDLPAIVGAGRLIAGERVTQGGKPVPLPRNQHDAVSGRHACRQSCLLLIPKTHFDLDRPCLRQRLNRVQRAHAVECRAGVKRAQAAMLGKLSLGLAADGSFPFYIAISGERCISRERRSTGCRPACIDQSAPPLPMISKTYTTSATRLRSPVGAPLPSPMWMCCRRARNACHSWRVQCASSRGVWIRG